MRPGFSEPRTIALATAYQALDPSKPALVALTLKAPTTLTLTTGTTITGDIRIGSAPDVATGGGTTQSLYKKSLTGTLAIGVNVATDDYETKSFMLPANGYFAVRQLTGSGLVVISASEQAMG